MFQPPLSWSTVRVWVPAGRVTVAATVVQVLVAAGGRDGDGAAQVGAGAVVDVQGVGDRGGRGQPQPDRVGARRRDVDGVLEPLPGRGPAQVVGAAAGVGGGLQVDPVGAVAVVGAVDRGDVVGHALPAGVVVLRVHGAGHRRRGPAVRALGGGPGRRARRARARQRQREQRRHHNGHPDSGTRPANGTGTADQPAHQRSQPQQRASASSSSPSTLFFFRSAGRASLSAYWWTRLNAWLA